MGKGHAMPMAMTTTKALEGSRTHAYACCAGACPRQGCFCAAHSRTRHRKEFGVVPTTRKLVTFRDSV